MDNVDPTGYLSFVISIGGAFTPVLGGEGWGGIYVTLPSPGNYFDIGVFGTGGLAAGWQMGTATEVGVIKGNESDIRGITINGNAAGGPGSLTVLSNCHLKPVGLMVGPSADLGASVTFAETKAFGLNNFGTWLGGWLYQALHPLYNYGE